jgi:hypothetical protein
MAISGENISDTNGDEIIATSQKPLDIDSIQISNDQDDCKQSTQTIRIGKNKSFKSFNNFLIIQQ